MSANQGLGFPGFQLIEIFQQNMAVACGPALDPNVDWGQAGLDDIFSDSTIGILNKWFTFYTVTIFRYWIRGHFISLVFDQ